ncbi:MAG: twin-arginine translocase subunit TatC [Gammaproteobacteria bacterium]|nr:twin-arginine translocase subunit TatC [Gammaproteobacteria bacterium]
MAEQEEQQSDSVESSSMGLMSHLVELRDRLLRVVISILAIFLCLFYWANDIYTYLAGPLTRHLPEGTQMIAIDVASPFLTPFKLVLMLSVFLAMPFILYQIWGFVAPGLYKHEKRLAGPLLASSIVLFYCGMLFAFYVVFPLVFGFFTSVGPEMVAISTDIGRYLDFVISLFFGFGLAFEVPIATILLVAIGMTTPDQLAEKRPYVIVGAFVLGMLLTPPDIISQVLLAVPIWVLFESGVIASRMIFAERLQKDAEQAAQDKADEENETGDDSNYGDDYEVVNDPAESSNNSAHQEYQPLTDAEMEAEMDRIEEAEHDENDDEDDDAYVEPASTSSTEPDATKAARKSKKKKDKKSKKKG